MAWYSINEQPTSLAERDLLRSWRAVCPRATHSLARRGYIESVWASVDLEDLGQLTDAGLHGEESFPVREVLLARTTTAGRDYVERRRSLIVDDMGVVGGDLRRALRARGFLDVAEPHPRPRRQQRRRIRIGNEVRELGPLAQLDPAEQYSEDALRRDEVVMQLVSEGFGIERVQVVIRAWHQDIQRYAPDFYRKYAMVSLDQQLFGLGPVSQ